MRKSGKYSDLINGLLERGKLQKKNYDALVAADGRALSPLLRALRQHPDDTVRETCAEILGDRKSWKAIPALIEALRDPCLFVRHDALWSIERICLYTPNALSFWLDLDRYRPDQMYRRVSQWWRLNRRYIEHNEAMQ